MFCSYFELFILVGLQQTVGLLSLIPIFVGNASLYSSCIRYTLWRHKQRTPSNNYHHTPLRCMLQNPL